MFKLIILLFKCVTCDFIINDLKIEALNPKGLRISYPAIDGIQLVAYHVNLNRSMNDLEPGDIVDFDIKKPIDGFWTYYDPDKSLRVGDILYYWVFIQHNSLGYRKQGQFEITELVNACSLTATKVLNRTGVCAGQLLFEDKFNTLNRNSWIVENYIPYSDPDYEFVSYQDNNDIIKVTNNQLIIKPKTAQNLEELRGEINFKDKCTRQIQEECRAISHSAFYLPPITSGKIVSNLYFKYGKVEIKAKLPAGDWVYPKIYLEKKSNPEHKIWIAYARGNKKLIGNNANDDIGGSLLFGGPVLSSQEPNRSIYLRSKYADSGTYSDQTFTYSIVWKPNKIDLFLNDFNYGSIDESIMSKIEFNDYMRLSIGVAVGGVNDFPDGYKSGDDKVKPWINKERTQVKKFILAKNQWYQTWKNDEPILKIDFVKIWAL